MIRVQDQEHDEDDDNIVSSENEIPVETTSEADDSDENAKHTEL